MGGCRFASECRTKDDCVLLQVSGGCCACAQPYPVSFSGDPSCLIVPNAPEPPECGTCQQQIPCPACLPEPVACLTSVDGLAHCASGAAVDIGPTQCVAEQVCPDIPGQGCTKCLPPGQRACGGPAPMPSDCSSDAECQLMADNLICEVLPCEKAHCVQGCLTDEDCGPSATCLDNHRCAAQSCAIDTDCTANFVCRAATCVRRSCVSSLDCIGYCVLNACYEEAGSCQDGCIP
jgi:hypothetical protein